MIVAGRKIQYQDIMWACPAFRSAGLARDAFEDGASNSRPSVISRAIARYMTRNDGEDRHRWR